MEAARADDDDGKRKRPGPRDGRLSRRRLDASTERLRRRRAPATGASCRPRGPTGGARGRRGSAPRARARRTFDVNNPYPAMGTRRRRRQRSAAAGPRSVPGNRGSIDRPARDFQKGAVTLSAIAAALRAHPQSSKKPKTEPRMRAVDDATAEPQARLLRAGRTPQGWSAQASGGAGGGQRRQAQELLLFPSGRRRRARLRAELEERASRDTSWTRRFGVVVALAFCFLRPHVLAVRFAGGVERPVGEGPGYGGSLRSSVHGELRARPKPGRQRRRAFR